MKYHKTLHKQKGISLSGLLVWSVILILISILGFRVLPSYIEYTSIKKNLNAVAEEASKQDSDINHIRQSFGKRAQIDNIKSISAQDIKITREKGRVVLSASYTSKIPLVSNVALVIDFEAISE